MGSLQFFEVTEVVKDCKFDCGIKSINDAIIDSYYPLLLQQAYTYSVNVDSQVIGYYQVMFRDIELTDFPNEISDFDSDIKFGKISAIHISFIAIEKRYQRKHIGTAVLRYIMKKVLDFSVNWPIRVITIDARHELVSWYEKMGFKVMNTIPEQSGVTVAMYFDCLQRKDQLVNFINTNLMSS